jgi:hypothetical protein
MRAESRLLGILADPYPDASQERNARDLLSQRLDGRFFLKQAQKEGVLGLIYYQAKTWNVLAFLPDPVREESLQAYYRYAARNTFLAEKIKPLCELFQREQVPLMILKGIALCHDIYPSPALRPVTDVDLLVRKEDRGRAEELLREAGYQFVFESSKKLRAHHRAMNSSFYADAEGSFSVHLHWHLVNNSWPVENIVDAISMDDIWGQARPYSFEGIQVSTLAPHHLLLFLLLHAFLHGSEHLIWLSDIAATVHKYGASLDRDLFRRDTEAWGLSYIAPEMLSLTGRIPGKDFSFLIDKNTGAAETLPLKFFSIFLKKNIRSILLSYLILLFLHKGLKQKLVFLYKTKLQRLLNSFGSKN